MVVDTSAIVAALTEPDGSRFVNAMRGAPTLALSTVNAYEARLVLSGRRIAGHPPDPRLLADFKRLIVRSNMVLVPFDTDQVVLAHEAYLRFGKGFHPASLNFADCAAYALAKLRGEPLLFKGSDFSQTDVTPALSP